MRVKQKNLIMLWIVFSLLLLIAFLCVEYKMGVLADELNIQENAVEASMVSLPKVKVIETEEVEIVTIPKEVEVEKEVVRYELPFENEYLGASDKTLPTKEYPRMKSNESITAFASENVFPEGTLVWSEGVGIRQIQTIYTDSNAIYVYFSSQSKADSF